MKNVELLSAKNLDLSMRNTELWDVEKTQSLWKMLSFLSTLKSQFYNEKH